MELSDYAENVLQQQLQTIKDVSLCEHIRTEALFHALWLDPDKMLAHNVSFTDVRSAVNTRKYRTATG